MQHFSALDFGAIDAIFIFATMLTDTQKLQIVFYLSINIEIFVQVN